MKQRVLISVLAADESQVLLETAFQRLQDRSIADYIESHIPQDRVLFYSEHLDLWSMGDSFVRFLHPKKHVRCFQHNSFVLYAISRERLRIDATARNEEERVLRSVLSHAKRLYRRAAPGSFVFVLRRVFGAST